MTLTVTIGLPVYNGGASREKALVSLLNQTYTNLTVVVADNASTDDTASICQAWAEKDARVQIHRHPSNIGAFENFRFVLNQAKTVYFMWAAHDDYYEPTFIKTMVDILNATPSAGVAASWVRQFEPQTNTTVGYLQGTSKVNPNSLYNYFIALLSMDVHIIYGLFRKDCIDACMHTCSFSDFSDAYVVQYMAVHSRIVVVPQYLLNYASPTKYRKSIAKQKLPFMRFSHTPYYLTVCRLIGKTRWSWVAKLVAWLAFSGMFAKNFFSLEFNRKMSR